MQAQNLQAEEEVISFTAVNGSTSEERTLMVFNYFEKQANDVSARLVENQSNAFKITSPVKSMIERGNSSSVRLVFSPASGNIGTFNAKLQIISSVSDKPTMVSLRGLSLSGLEGSNEPPLADVLDVLGYQINIGWEDLTTTTTDDLKGDEISASLFSRAEGTYVELIPVARFSPDFVLPYGYYEPNQKTLPKLFQVGELAAKGDRHEHQTTYPNLKSGDLKFIPQRDTFGIFTYSPTHLAFSEDFLNEKFYPTYIKHAVRVFPLRDSEGESIQNSYLVCFEEAKNGDYQDYVFLLKNVKVVD